jgi:hypothetical protein
MLAGDVDTGNAILRDYIKATSGFEKLGEATGTPTKSLIRMLGPRGNPIHAMDEGSPQNSGAVRRRARCVVAKDPVRVRTRLGLAIIASAHCMPNAFRHNNVAPGPNLA